MKHPSELHTELKDALNNYMIAVVNAHIEQVLRRLRRVIVKDGEQFVAGEIKKIAEEREIIL